MDLIPILFGSDRTDNDFFRMYLALMTRYLGDVQYVIYQTRDYHNGLPFCDELDAYNSRFYAEGRLTDEQHQTFHCSIAGFRLDMYDNLDYWEDFVRYFDELLETTNHTVLWMYEDDHETELKRYFISVDAEGLNSEMHWLFQYDKRYRLIQRKLEKLRRDGKVGNLKHKRRSELTEDEVRERFNHAMKMIQLWRGT
ncbi:hypothetical protein [Alicyclobacillus dauci]|uniref:Bacteriophage Gp15 protein n=1 Tax=Alicyclobacillus dauci TaxID=1475485 RepID=A0ABY6YXG4_9BACL|nr:hypothetical protein [Alicyclobacillus dauci]WAH35079.1 hypothetical protein NZD86_12145 [Alicyclobacillus dauci]